MLVALLILGLMPVIEAAVSIVAPGAIESAAATTPYPSEIAADSPVAYWRLADGLGTTAADASGNGRTGTYSTGVVRGQMGVLGGDPSTSVELNDGYVDFGDNAAYEFSSGSSFSVEWWMKTTEAGSPDGKGIFSKGWVGGFEGPAYLAMIDNGKVLFQVRKDSSTATNVTSAASASDGRWHFWNAVYDASAGATRLYRDGALTASASGVPAAAYGQNSRTFRVGNAYANRAFNAQVDEVAVYAGTLSATRIAAHWGARGEDAVGTPASYRSEVLTDSPYTYLPLEERISSVAADASGNGRTATYSAGTGPGPFGPSSAAASFATSGQSVSFTSAMVPATGDWTVEAFALVLGNGFGGGNTLWSQYTDNYATRTLAQAGSGGTVTFQIGDASLTAPADLASQRWKHVVIRRAGTTISLLVDGKVVSSTTMTGAVDTKVTNVGSHHQSGISTGSFNGRISNFAVYRSALSDARIAAHYRAAGPVGGPLTPDELYGGRNPAGLYQPCVCADPVDPGTGNFFETFEDLAIPGRGVPLAFSHTYNSLAAGTDGPLGYGWTHPYAMGLGFAAEGVTVRQENGSQVRFVPTAGGFAPAAPRMLATLVQNADGTYTYTRRFREIFTFDSTGRLTAQKDRNGYTTTVTHPSATTTVVTDPGGRTLTLTSSSGRVTSVADSAGRSVGFSYDGSGNLTQVTDVAGGRTTFTYDGAHRVVTKRSPKFFGDTTTTPSPVVTNHYDASGRVDWQSDPLGRTTSFDYTSIPGSTKVTDPRGNATLFSYAHGVLTSMTEAYGTAGAATTTYSYDQNAVGHSSVTDAEGRTTSAVYDANGNLAKATDGLGRTTSYTYDADGDLLSATDPSGVATTMTYSTSGNLLTTSRPLTGMSQSQTVTNTYGDVTKPGDVTSVSDPRGKVSTLTYDAAGSRTSVTDPVGNKTTFGYDGAGRMTSTVAPKGNVIGANPAAYTTTIAYNAFGDVTSTTDPLGHEETKAYDANRNLTSATDANDHTTTNTYNPANELVTVTRPDNTTRTLTYDDAGNRVVERDGANNATTYGFDARNRVTSVTDPLSRTTTFGYDKVGNRTSLTDPASAVTTFGYDAANQLTSISYSDPNTPDVSLGYNTLGQRTSMTDGTGTSSASFDSLGRLTSSTNGAGTTVGYAYDLANNLTTLTYPGSQAVTRGYDDAGRWTSVTDWASRTTSFAYDDNSNLTTIGYPNATTSTRTYDAADRLTAIDHSGTSGSLAGFTYTRDDAGRLASTTSAGVGANETYGYTSLDQLSTVNASTYAYDTADNLTQLASGGGQGFDAANQLCWSTTSAPGGSPTCAAPPTGATTYAYDSRGNRTARTPASGPATSYGYDQANRLTSAGGSTYAYDGNGLRASKTVSGTTTAFTWSAAEGLPLLLGEGSTRYVYGPVGVLEQVTGAGAVHYYHHDQLGSVRALTDSSGATAATSTFDAYGSLASSTGSVANPFGFASEYTDAETGFQYLRARYYDPTTGQFLNRDPLAAQTGEPYGYVGGNPLNYTDPSGLCWGPGCWVEDAVMVGQEILGHPGDAAADAAKGAGNFGVGFVNAALGTSFKGWCGEGQSWSRNIGSATFFVEATLATGLGGAGAEAETGVRGITGYTRHGLNQAISRDGHGVAANAILDAVRSPTNVVPDAARGTTQYVGERAVVVLNDSGRVVTTWARNALGWRF